MKARIVSAVLVMILLTGVSTSVSAHGWRHCRPYVRYCAPIVRVCPPVRVYAPVPYVRYCPPPPPRYCYNGPYYRPRRYYHRGYYAY